MIKQPVYLDCQSTTPMDARVTKVVCEAFERNYGNPHGRQHYFSRLAADAIDDARGKVAFMLGTYPQRILFTSGATESCNLAICGVAKCSSGNRKKIITVATEHSAVLETVKELEKTGFEIEILPVNSVGLLDLNLFEDRIDETTLLVSVMAVNNEIGVIQPIREMADICHRHGVLFHSDATQAVGRININVSDWNVDLLTISSHKLYGPKGIGALYISDDAILVPLLKGGGQERGFRSGTVPTPLVCGCGEAARIVTEEWRCDAERMASLSNKLWHGLECLSPELNRFGSLEHRAPGSLCFGFPEIFGDTVVTNVESEIAISTGSSCSSHKSSISHVLAALGCPREVAATGVRVGLGRFTTENDINIALTALEINFGI